MEQDIVKILEEKNGFFRHNDYHVVEVTEECVTLQADLNENSMNPYEIAHGGFIFGLGDTAMGILCRVNEKEVLTLNANIHYVRPGTGKYLVAKSKMIKKGKKISVLQADIYNDQDKLVATMTSDYYED